MNPELMAFIIFPLGLYLVYYVFVVIPRENNAPYRYQVEQEKLKYQNFVLAVRNVYPNAVFPSKDIYWRMQVPLTNGKKRVGKIDIETYKPLIFEKKFGEKDLHYLTIIASVGDRKFEFKHGQIQDEVNPLREALVKLNSKLVADEELRRVLIATTY